ncbi:MAG: stage V sporulation protein AC [Tissierellia bacterium]|jgi:stage V sporulation protein AB|nr:stage V sporulation protein AC [Tissierellia bacterium]
MNYILPIVSSFSGGLVAGGAFISFVTLLEIFPRLMQFTNTDKYQMLYESIYILSTIAFTILYFSDFYIRLNSILVVIIGLLFGVYLGLFSSALAEILNVLPVILKKIKIKRNMKFVFYSLAIGKVAGALYYFIFKIGG